MPKGGIIFCAEIARAAMVYIICPWHSWIARETPTLEAAGSNPVGQAKNSTSCSLSNFLSKPQAWHIIDARSAAYIIKGDSPPLYIITRQRVSFLRLDNIQHFVLMICNALH